MKKHMSGFVPIKFNQAGKVLLIIGLVCVIIKVISYLTGWFFVTNYLIYAGVVLIIIGLYLMFIVSNK